MKLETFFEKFDQFADAPDAVAKMRELVLHWERQRRAPYQPGATPQENRPPIIPSPEGAGQRAGLGCVSGFAFGVLDRPFRAWFVGCLNTQGVALGWYGPPRCGWGNQRMQLETFFEKFDQFADAPDAVAKMRELVLPWGGQVGTRSWVSASSRGWVHDQCVR